MIEAALIALAQLFTLKSLLYIIIGVLIGSLVGILPGMGGTVGLALVLPFIYGMDTYNALAFMIGLAAVTTTADSFTSILFGVPGTSGSQATIMDGYPMSQNGEGARALSAAFVSSMFGGVIGAVVLFISVPIAKPLILSFHSPELFMLSLLGISVIAMVVGNKPIKGFIVAFLGLFLGTIGSAPATPEYRYTFDWLYLYEGIPLVILILGIYAVPELIEFISSDDQRIARKSTDFKGTKQGIKDVFNNKRLVVQSAGIGSFVGFIPGIGGSVVDWLAYGVAKKTLKNTDTFGKGDIRGVIAPESANNAKDGGALIPTILFSIPGSGAMAVLLAGFMLIGVEPGPKMLTDNLSLTFTIIFTLVLSNIFATSLSLAISKPFSNILSINPKKFVPFLFVIIFAGSYQASRDWGDFLLILVISVIGWILKEFGWPRIPLIIAFVLSTGAERYLFLSMSSYDGFVWLLRPGVITIFIFTVLLLTGGAIFNSFQNRREKII